MIETLLPDAFAQLGIDAHRVSDSGVDLVLNVNGVSLAIQVKRRALVDETAAEQILRAPAPPGHAFMIVADRVTERARKILASRGVGYLDLRGRLALRADGVVIDADVEPLRSRPLRTSALRGKAGLEVACAVLMKPEQPTPVRELARQLGRAASTVSDILSSMRSEGLIDARNAVTDSRLFWHVADHWATPRTYLSQLPSPGDAPVAQALRLGLNDAAGIGWALTDSAAAAAYGAPVAFRSGQILDFYVPDQAVHRRATALLGVADGPSQAQATARIAPVPAVVRPRVDLDASPFEWPLTHPLFVALDLALDAGRGREILDSWTPNEQWTRVW